MAVIAFILIFLTPIADSSPDNWIIDNSTNSVYVDDAKAYISVSPHTLKESGDIIINLKSKVYTGNIDVVFGFDTTEVKPISASLYDFSTQKYKDVSSSFEKVNYAFGGMNTWYFKKNVPVVAGVDYRLKVSVQVPYISKGKYWIAIKPSSETIAQAITNGHLYYLDPWWDATWLYKIDNTITNGTRPYQLLLNVSNATGVNNATHVFCGGKCNVNFTDIRFALDDTTPLSYLIENATTGKVWVNVTANGTVNMYYANPGASSASSGQNFVVWASDTMVQSNDTEMSYSVAGGTEVERQIISLPYIIKGTVRMTYDMKGQTNNAFHGHIRKNAVEISNQGYTASGNYDHFTQDIVINSNATDIIALYFAPFTYNVAVYAKNFRLRYTYVDPTKSTQTWATWSIERSQFVSSWGNNYTNDDDLIFSIYENKVINFNVTKRYPADTVNWFIDSVNQSNNFNNISVNVNIVGTKNITAVVTNTTVGTGSVSWSVTLGIQLLTPVNGTTLYSPYPPAAPKVIFVWTSTGYPFYNLLIATDANFNTVVSSTYPSSETANVYLLSGKQYFWKVRTYIDLFTPSAWSGTSYFNLTANYSLPANTTGVYGVVYEKKGDGSLLPISDAVVNIANTTWSDLVISGTNGYYQFSGLKAGDVYTIRATANGYEAGSTEYINSTLNTWTQKNLFLQTCRSGFTCFYDQHFVRFTVQNIWFTKYAGVTANVYKGSELVASDTQTTGTDGSVNFLLIKDQQYRITFINVTQGISVTWIGYPAKTEYLIITDATTSSWDTHGTDAATTTDIEVTTQTINDTHAYIHVNYSDTLAGTSNLMFYLNKTIPGDPNNQTVLQSIDGGNNDQYNASFLVSGYAGNSYFVKVKAAHSTYGTISYSYAVQFAQLPGPLANFDPTIILMLFVAFILFVSGIFGQTTNTMGAGIIVGIIWILSGVGVFSAANIGLNFYLALTLASVVVLIMNVNERGRQEALQ